MERKQSKDRAPFVTSHSLPQYFSTWFFFSCIKHIGFLIFLQLIYPWQRIAYSGILYWCIIRNRHTSICLWWSCFRKCVIFDLKRSASNRCDQTDQIDCLPLILFWCSALTSHKLPPHLRPLETLSVRNETAMEAVQCTTSALWWGFQWGLTASHAIMAETLQSLSKGGGFTGKWTARVWGSVAHCPFVASPSY